MNPVNKIVKNFSAKAREKRAKVFLENFALNDSTKILDLGSESGVNIHNILKSTNVKAENVFIADIDEGLIKSGAERFGFNAVLIEEKARIDFDDKFFDIVYCSSVIEHTTVDKAEVWEYKTGAAFKDAAWQRQKLFAAEIIRLGKQYFVQTPCKSFPVESHTWLPLVGYLPREVLLPVLKVSNRYWVKAAAPDFNLLGEGEMKNLFPNAKILKEKSFGLTKSLMAVKSNLKKSSEKE
jgi:SAM-dependent methyltransferase